jgi:hypothetical protein
MGSVLLTAAVTPNPRYSSTIADASVRLSQYQEALAAWSAEAAHVGWKTIVVETTGCSEEELLANLRPQFRDAVSVIPYCPTDNLASRGKGAVEAAAIDHVLGLSATTMTRSSTFYKVTGRLLVSNAKKLLFDVRENTAVVRRSMNGVYCDTRFFGTTVGFWRDQMTGMANEVDDAEGRYLEHVMAHRLTDAEYAKAAEVIRFPQRPIIVGRSGTTGSTYGGFGAAARSLLLAPYEKLLADKMMTKQV